MNIAPIIKIVRGYDPVEWEVFISEWQKGLTGYVEVKRIGGAGDLGRDVIGLCTPSGCKGMWDNFQCKHYEKPLAAAPTCTDAGKIIFHAFNGAFAPPRRNIFVAPRGPTTELRDLLLNPDKFRAEVLSTWQTRVAKNVVENESHPLIGDLKKYAEAYDYSSFGYATIEEVLDGHRKTAYWASRFQGALPPPPKGKPPVAIAPLETVYVAKLLDVYAEKLSLAVINIGALGEHKAWSDDLVLQRIRFYDAEAFVAHYRDQTEPGTVEDFAEQICDAITPGLTKPGAGHDRLTSALTTAAQATPANILAPQAKIRVRQGVCHQLANMDRVTWKT